MIYRAWASALLPPFRRFLRTRARGPSARFYVNANGGVGGGGVITDSQGYRYSRWDTNFLKRLARMSSRYDVIKTVFVERSSGGTPIQCSSIIIKSTTVLTVDITVVGRLRSSCSSPAAKTLKSNTAFFRAL